MHSWFRLYTSKHLYSRMTWTSLVSHFRGHGSILLVLPQACEFGAGVVKCPWQRAKR